MKIRELKRMLNSLPEECNDLELRIYSDDDGEVYNGLHLEGTDYFVLTDDYEYAAANLFNENDNPNRPIYIYPAERPYGLTGSKPENKFD